MGDIDIFGGLDAGGESFDAAAFEKFKERMKRAAAQLKALQKQEKKQKKTEDELIKILIKFIKTGKRKDVLLLVTRLLEMNVPAGFIVSVLLISNPDIQQELGVKLLPAGETEKEVKKNTNLPDLYIGGEVLPLKTKIAILNWINEITKRVNEKPHRCIKTLLDEKDKVQLTAIQLGAFCLRDFLNQQQVTQEYDQLKDFVSFILSDIISKAAEDLKHRKELT
jgi:hypothetical protein